MVEGSWKLESLWLCRNYPRVDVQNLRDLISIHPITISSRAVSSFFVYPTLLYRSYIVKIAL
jgi:hypothetical protein